MIEKAIIWWCQLLSLLGSLLISWSFSMNINSLLTFLFSSIFVSWFKLQISTRKGLKLPYNNKETNLFFWLNLILSLLFDVLRTHRRKLLPIISTIDIKNKSVNCSPCTFLYHDYHHHLSFFTDFSLSHQENHFFSLCTIKLNFLNLHDKFSDQHDGNPF